MGLSDRTGICPLRMFSHVKITHPRHAYFHQTGTVVRIDTGTRRVWVSLPSGTVVPAGHRSVEVIVPRPAR